MGIGLPVIKIHKKITFLPLILLKTKFLEFGGQNANRRFDSHELKCTHPTLLKKVIGRNRTGIGVPVLKTRKKSVFHLLCFEKLSVWGLGGQNANRRCDSRET